jgi:hypothetical protein
MSQSDRISLSRRESSESSQIPEDSHISSEGVGSEKSGTFGYFDAVRSESGSIGDKQSDIFTGQKYREFNENYHLLHWHPTYCVLGIKDKNDFQGVN